MCLFSASFWVYQVIKEYSATCFYWGITHAIYDFRACKFFSEVSGAGWYVKAVR